MVRVSFPIAPAKNVAGFREAKLQDWSLVKPLIIYPQRGQLKIQALFFLR